jgi:hypothetical protein
MLHGLLLLKPVVAVVHRKHRNGKVTSVMTSLSSMLSLLHRSLGERSRRGLEGEHVRNAAEPVGTVRNSCTQSDVNVHGSTRKSTLVTWLGTLKVLDLSYKRIQGTLDHLNSFDPGLHYHMDAG